MVPDKCIQFLFNDTSFVEQLDVFSAIASLVYIFEYTYSPSQAKLQMLYVFALSKYSWFFPQTKQSKNRKQNKQFLTFKFTFNHNFKTWAKCSQNLF